MTGRRMALAGMLGLAILFSGAKSAQAQSYFYGYYYPDEHRFHSAQLNTNVLDYSTVTPMWNALHDTKSGYSYPIVPTNSLLHRPPLPSPQTPPQTKLKVTLPDAKAVVWFNGYLTSSMGTQRVYQAPPMKPGMYDYTLKVSYNQGGRVVIEERTVTVRAGQSYSVDFTQNVAAASAPRE